MVINKSKFQDQKQGQIQNSRSKAKFKLNFIFWNTDLRNNKNFKNLSDFVS
jgi:hypothetical protein